MRVRTPAQRPMELAIRLGDRQVVDAGKAPAHQTVFSELPVLVAVAAIPVARVVMPLVGEAHRDALAGAGPQLLDQAVVQLPGPLALQEGADLLAALGKLG